jgi:hypothetical protein
MKEKCHTYSGCLFRLFLVAFVLFSILFLISLLIDYKRRQHPFFTEREIVEGYSGIEFPEYTLVNTSKYMNHATLRFDSIPDSLFYKKLDSLTTISYVCKRKNEEMYDTLHIWFYNDSLKYYYLYVPNSLAYYDINPHIETLIRQGVPRSFFTKKGTRYYSIHIPYESKEWEIHCTAH